MKDHPLTKRQEETFGIDFPTDPRSDEDVGELTKTDYNLQSLRSEESPKKDKVEVIANAPS